MSSVESTGDTKTMEATLTTSTSGFFFNFDDSTKFPYLYPVIDDKFFDIMRIRLAVSSWLSLQCIVENMFLLTFLFTSKEFRSWLFFPLMMQATIDVIGPGIANMAFEWKLYNYWPKLSERIVETDLQKPFITDYQLLMQLHGIGACLLMHLRCLLNDYSTGYCLLATAIFRYVLVCHPTINIRGKMKKTAAALLVLILITALTCSAIDMLVNDTAYDRISVFDKYGPEIQK